MLGELLNVPTDTLFDMLYIVLAREVAISASDAWRAAKQGRLIKAAKHVFDSRNVTSIKAVWEDRKWIGGV